MAAINGTEVPKDMVLSGESHTKKSEMDMEGETKTVVKYDSSLQFYQDIPMLYNIIDIRTRFLVQHRIY